jgi:hypothetical protein
MVQVLPIKSPKPAVELDSEFYPRMICVEMRAQCRYGFCYRDLTRLYYDPAGTVMVIFETGDAIVIHGRCLKPVWEALHSHRATLLREGTEAESDLRADGEPHIDGITVRLSDEWLPAPKNP